MAPAVFFQVALPTFTETAEHAAYPSWNKFTERYEVPVLVHCGLDFREERRHNWTRSKTEMSAPSETVLNTAWPKTLRFCQTCHRETPHQLRQGTGVVVTICVPCLERALSYELDRD